MIKEAGTVSNALPSPTTAAETPAAPAYRVPPAALGASRDVVFVGYRGVDASTTLACPEVVRALRHAHGDVLAEGVPRAGGVEQELCVTRGCRDQTPGRSALIAVTTLGARWGHEFNVG